MYIYDEIHECRVLELRIEINVYVPGSFFRFFFLFFFFFFFFF